jgi:Putative DNA-binding domain
MKLADVQRQMQESVLRANTGAAALVKPPVEGTSASRLAVYQQAYGLRHAEFVRNDFPSLLTYLGEDKFNAMASLYARMNPSSHPNARWFSAKVPEFLAVTLPFSRKPELSELAALERGLGDAFDAEDTGHLTLAELAACDPSGFADMALGIHPSARLLTFRTNAASIWSSLKADERPPSPIMLQAPQDVLVWRQAFTSRFRLLGGEETMAFQSARQGLPFGIICEMIATFGDPDTAGIRAASYLRGWIESELIVALRLADAAGAK